MKFFGTTIVAALALALPGALAGPLQGANAAEAALAQQLAGGNLDPNNLQASLASNIGQLMLALGVCNFNVNSLRGLSIVQEVQLLNQVQQLAQLRALGVINPQVANQLLQPQNLIVNLNKGIIKRTIDGAVEVCSPIPLHKRPHFGRGPLTTP